MGMRPNITILHAPSSQCPIQAVGGSLSCSNAAIYVGPESSLTKNNQRRQFILTHELSHIKHNDVLKIGLVSTLAYVVTAVAASFFLPVAGTVGVAFSVFLITLSTMSRHCEKRADLEAQRYCQLMETRQFCQALQELQNAYQQYRNNTMLPFTTRMWNKIRFDSKGNDRLDILHPSLSQRISYLA